MFNSNCRATIDRKVAKYNKQEHKQIIIRAKIKKKLDYIANTYEQKPTYGSIINDMILQIYGELDGI